jgi:hypothetical protein
MSHNKYYVALRIRRASICGGLHGKPSNHGPTITLWITLWMVLINPSNRLMRIYVLEFPSTTDIACVDGIRYLYFFSETASWEGTALIPAKLALIAWRRARAGFSLARRKVRLLTPKLNLAGWGVMGSASNAPPPLPPFAWLECYLTKARLRVGQYVITSKMPSIKPMRANEAAASFMRGLLSRMAAMNRFMPTGGVL